ncbi:MAG: hypoxanthine phosphoribosyltransferase, partial [Nitrospirae bacterium]
MLIYISNSTAPLGKIHIIQEVAVVVGKPLLSEEDIQKKVRELAEQISNDFSGEELVAVGILKGAFMFFADLVRHIKVPLTIDFIVASSYVKESTTGEVKIYYNLREDIKDKNVLLVEDIVDTGVTLNYLRERFLEQSPKNLKICALLDKKERRLVDVP